MTAIRLGRPALALCRTGATGRAFTSSSVPVEGIVSIADIHLPDCPRLVSRNLVLRRARLIGVELCARNGVSFHAISGRLLAEGRLPALVHSLSMISIGRLIDED